MSTDDEFTARISEISASIGQILRDDMESQRQANAGQLRAILEQARNKVGGEFAEALLQVMLTVNRWEGQAMASAGRTPTISLEVACRDIITAIETGLGARQQ